MVRIVLAFLLACWLAWQVMREPEGREQAAAHPQVAQAQFVKNVPPTRAQRQANLALIVPVQDVTGAQLVDTWGDARSEGRRHQGIDIMAPRGRAVVAAVDGRIVKFFDSERGGTTIYQFDGRGRYVYYYAHLESRAVGLAEGDVVRQGQIIGYVGSTVRRPNRQRDDAASALRDSVAWAGSAVVARDVS